ncbi:hypothetical protein MKW98_010627 [Papaver atlanticum]|uniref:P-type ATPase A domain-containing protein n=1 Tax=Papaver atlanticum TaxID=357466 RepID=A0AAD4S2D8_9MAGN|nr:hypothetical protein MKW98_010627 [Papaver atlanticum]
MTNHQVRSTSPIRAQSSSGRIAPVRLDKRKACTPKSKVLRDGRWQEKDASVLVPGDIISIKLGDIIPADARLLEGDPIKIDQSALTGESLNVTKKAGDEVYSGSTYVVGHFQKVLTSIGNFCICSIAVGMILEIILCPPCYPLRLQLSHIAANNRVLLQKMTVIEEMAGMDVLCSDKTGTLTLNRLTVDGSLTELTQRRHTKTSHQFIFYRSIDSEGNWHRASKGAPEQILNLCEEKEQIAAKVHVIIDNFAESGLWSLGVACQEVPEKSEGP